MPLSKVGERDMDEDREDDAQLREAARREIEAAKEYEADDAVCIMYDDELGRWVARRGCEELIALSVECAWCDGNAIEEAARRFGVPAEAVVVTPA